MGDRPEALEVGEAVQGEPGEAPLPSGGGELAALAHGDAHGVPAGAHDPSSTASGRIASSGPDVPTAATRELDPRHAAGQEIAEAYAIPSGRRARGARFSQSREEENVLAPVDVAAAEQVVAEPWAGPPTSSLK